MIDLEARREYATERMTACGCNKAADHMRQAPRVGERGWVAKWHAVIDRCDQDITYVADGGGDNVEPASQALRMLFRSLCEDHEEARRCASR